ncbi:integrase family protein [Desulfofarcimen acetoxidans DSM 771]|uniref:Integrase family protein n=1 Tax=Desulfofarcimen acetoxidans (strain ATCC 49208 / DSM 771 / KCTC 5769 / VKM B-1644 / 5575) TaxID=485916 RepID=C8VWK7_DESAS|nr:site-specific integrase [Desulfofarcimen acetoxidans]ACV64371.1 integrase family protein [Desulfofarcimen acetoxidans DSM 771]
MAGWVESRGKNKWRLNVPDGTGPDGKRITHRKVVEATSEREAKKLLDVFSAEVQKGQYIAPSKLTFKEFSQKWLESKKDLAPKTLYRYKEILNSRILPAMGHLKIEDIKPFHIMQFYGNLQEPGIREDGKEGTLSPATVLYHHRLLTNIFNAAVKWQIILTNPALRVEAPKAKKHKATSYEEEDTAALLSALEEQPLKFQAIVYIALGCGLRRGEIMGLEWKDIDLTKGTLEVRQSSQYLPGHGTFAKSPKNESSERIIAVPTETMSLLKQHRVQQNEQRLQVGGLWQASDRLFTTWDGKPMHPDSITKWFSGFLKNNNLSPLPFHGLRHTAASYMIKAGIPLKNIASRLGHSSPNTTLNIYAHSFKSVDAEAANKMNDILTTRKKGQA